MRTHYCGAITDTLVGDTVTICGWVDRRRDHGGVIFLDMRDRDGIVQVVFDPDTEESFALADRVRSEYVLQITGRVRDRDAATINPNMATGRIEILGKELTLLNEEKHHLRSPSMSIRRWARTSDCAIGLWIFAESRCRTT